MQTTGGTTLVQSLLAHGVDTLFGLPGVQNDALYNALYDAGDQIRVVHCRHEQETGYMALGYAQATGNVGVFNIVPGPGLLNAGAALATAYGLNARVLCIVGQIPTRAIGKGKGVLHELPDQFAILQQLTKWSASAKSPDEIPALVAEAFRQLNIGRPRPVGLEVPMDVLAASWKLEVASRKSPIELPTVTAGLLATLKSAGKILGQSKESIIYVGGGAQAASESIRELSEMLQAPVVGYRTGAGVQDARNPLSLHLPPSHELWKTTDAALFIGTHGRIPLQKWGVDDEMTVIKIDVDSAEHDVIRTPDIALTGRAEEIVPLLVEETRKHNHKRESRAGELNALKAEWEKRTDYMSFQKAYLRAIREALGEDGILVEELTQVGFAARIIYPTYHPHTYISTGYMGTLGFGFPTALGVKIGKPDTPVVAISGDGGFMFGVQALATAVQHKIGLVTVIFNNDQYGNVQQMQRNLYDGRVIATDLVNPDFVALAKAFGANGVCVRSPDELGEALQRGFASDLPTIIEVPMPDVASVDRFRDLGRVRG